MGKSTYEPLRPWRQWHCRLWVPSWWHWCHIEERRKGTSILMAQLSPVYTSLVVSRGQYSPQDSKKTPHSSPIRAVFVSPEFHRRFTLWCPWCDVSNMVLYRTVIYYLDLFSKGFGTSLNLSETYVHSRVQQKRFREIDKYLNMLLNMCIFYWYCCHVVIYWRLCCYLRWTMIPIKMITTIITITTALTATMYRVWD